MKKAAHLAICILILLASPLGYSEVNRSSEHGFAIANTVQSSASNEQIYNALINQVDFWWPKDHSWWKGTMRIDAFAGGCFCETSNNNSAEHMRITMVVPQQKLVMVGGLGPLRDMGLSGALVWQLTPFDEGTRVTLTYTVNGVIENNADALAAVVDKVQHQQLLSLITYTEQN